MDSAPNAFNCKVKVPIFRKVLLSIPLVTYRKLSTLWKKMDAHLSLKCTSICHWSSEEKGGSRTPTRHRCVSVLLNDSRALHSPVGCRRLDNDRQAVFPARIAQLTVWLSQKRVLPPGFTTTTTTTYPAVSGHFGAALLLAMLPLLDQKTKAVRTQFGYQKST